MRLKMVQIGISSLAAIATCVAIAGCSGEQTGAATSSTNSDTSKPVTQSKSPSNEVVAGVVGGEKSKTVSAAVSETSPTNKNASAADLAWKEFRQALKPNSPPPEWQTNAPSEAAVAEFNKKNGALAGSVADIAREFYTKYPDDSRAKDAQRFEKEFLKAAVQTGNTNFSERLAAVEKNYSASPAGKRESEIEQRIHRIQRAAEARQSEGQGAVFEEFEKGMRQLAVDFPEAHEPYLMALELMQMSERKGDVEKLKSLSEFVAGSKAPEEIKADAAFKVKRFTFLGKPIALKFKAIDGREVDLSKMRGKVVMIDFWATWCPPCVALIPHAKEAYEKYHSKGLEVIGISLDREEEALRDFIKQKSLPWPQYYAGDGEMNQIAMEFGISPIPEVWLIDKKGILRDQNGAIDLDEKVEKYLAE